MSAFQEYPSLEQPKDILANCIRLNPQDGAFMRHPVIESYGSPKQPIYVDNAVIDINGMKYEHPMILPIYNGQLTLIQCAVLQDKQPVQIFPDGRLAKGFAYYGRLHKDRPVIIARELEEFFSVARTTYAVVLVVLPDMCKTNNRALKQNDVNAMELVVKQLWNAGYKQLYIPTRPQNKELLFEVTQSQKVQLIDKYRSDGSFMEFTQYEMVQDVQAFIDNAIEELPVFQEHWKEPKQIKSELLPVKKITEDMLPLDVYKYCADEAKRADNMTFDLVAVCLLTSLGALIGARVAIKPKQLDDYSIVPNLWGGIIAPPSSKKSPAISAGTRHLDRLVLQAKEQFELEQKDNIAKAIMFKSAEKELAKKLDKAKEENEKLKLAKDIADMQTDANHKPILKRYFTNDSSPEALADLERSNPNGILVIRDELIGLLSSLDQNDTDTGRAFYLEGWNGTGSYQFDRITRGSGYIQNHCLSVLGGIQPDKLMSYLEKTIHGMGNDGLLQRFQLLIYPDLAEWQYADKKSDKVAKEAVFNLFKQLDELNEYELTKLGAKPSDEFNARPYFRFTAEAQQAYKTWSTKLNSQTIPNEEHTIIQEHLSKFGKLMPALALIFHLIDSVQLGVSVGGVSLNCVEMAIKWCDYLESHARRIYGMVLHSATFKASALAIKLKKLNHNESWRMDGFSARDVHRKNWKGLNELNTVNDALELLVDYGWLNEQEIESTERGGRPSKRYLINPKIYNSIK
ncbi:YfjI family protein [Acinetobacter sp. UBA6720]|uniref:YfjI family protein n=1 Tax=Acinetobacter sp. UBA6720 TaxID=1945953 RepID=UPI0025BE63AE|nr:YfjI family protein [Acinetobacter sp. UBA6720]